MCGFVALFSSRISSQKHEAITHDMLSRIAHRGPDGEGSRIIEGQASFGHKRLAVIDLRTGGQPMVSDDQRYTLVFNGEIYNYLELRRELVREGLRFRTDSDSEVLLLLLISRGAAALQYLNGMFAFVFHDRQEDTWLAARDHFGIKPLYYTSIEDELLFGSEIKALLSHPKVNISRDNQALEQYLTFQFCLENRTLFSGIKKIAPGHYLTGRSARILRDVCYWDTDYQIDNVRTEELFREELGALLKDTARLQVQSDVPLGAYLSGGLDSSVVSSLASEITRQPLPVFHGKFSDGSSYDESFYAQKCAEGFGGQYHEVTPTKSDFAHHLPALIEALDEPVAGPGLFPQFMTSRLAKKHVTVVLGGQGGDEIFGGYARYLIGYLEQSLKGAILGTQEEGNHVVTLASIVPNLSILRGYTPLLENFWKKGLFEGMDARYFRLIDRSQHLNRFLNPDMLKGFDSERVFCEFQKVFNHPDTVSYINKMTHFDQKTLLPALLQIEDRVSMAASLESRVPLLDRRIVDLVTKMPPPMKFKGGRPKNILKEVAEGLVPSVVLDRKDKMGFPVPLDEWMRGGVVRDFVSDVLLSEKSRNRGIFTPDALRAMLDNRGVGARALWGALSLELWHQTFIDVD